MNNLATPNAGPGRDALDGRAIAGTAALGQVGGVCHAAVRTTAGAADRSRDPAARPVVSRRTRHTFARVAVPAVTF